MPRFIILMYHMISEPCSKKDMRYACPPAQFDKHMCFLRSKEFNPIGLDIVQKYLNGAEPIPPNSVVVTLDDGLCDNYENAFPVLRKYKIPATIFLVAGKVGKTNEWMQVDGFSRRQMLNWYQVEEMSAAGISFGAHTMTHPRLTKLSTAEAIVEIRESKKIIEDHLGQRVPHFAYPYGLFTEETSVFVKSTGYSMACSTRSGFNNQYTDPYILRRIEVYGTDALWRLNQKLTFGMNDAGLLYPLKYYWSRIRARIS